VLYKCIIKLLLSIRYQDFQLIVIGRNL